MTKPTKQQTKKARQENIEKFMHEMIYEENVRLSTLNEICEKLAKKGIKASRATIDRDLGELGFIKNNGEYIYQPSEDKEEQERRYRKEKFLRANIIDNIISGCGIFPIKTTFGTGKGVASRLKSLFPKLILGTVADDNMVLVITREADGASQIHNEIGNIKKRKIIQPDGMENILSDSEA